MEEALSEHRIFRSMQYVFRLQNTMRFSDPVNGILTKMRLPGGTNLTDPEWQALLRTDFGARQPAVSIAEWLQDTEDWHHAAYPWRVASIAQHLIASGAARKARQALYYRIAHDLTMAPYCCTCPRPAEQTCHRTNVRVLLHPFADVCPHHGADQLPFAVIDSTGIIIVGIEHQAIAEETASHESLTGNVVVLGSFHFPFTFRLMI